MKFKRERILKNSEKTNRTKKALSLLHHKREKSE